MVIRLLSMIKLLTNQFMIINKNKDFYMKTKMKKIIASIIASLMVAVTMGISVSAATFSVVSYHYNNSKVYGIRAASSGYSSYVTTWAKATDKNSSSYNANRGYKSSSANASVVWDSGSLTRTAGNY